MVKNLPTNAGATGDTGLISGSGRSPGGGHGNPLQYSCLENPMDRGALTDYNPWPCKEADMTEGLSRHDDVLLMVDTSREQCYTRFLFSVLIFQNFGNRYMN